jgi:hypothetical protein
MKLREDYILAKCCRPEKGDAITGYYSHNNIIKVHRSECASLNKADTERLVKLNWDDIIAAPEFKPDTDYSVLNDFDFRILQHHQEYGVDYSLKVAAILHADQQKVFDSHRKLRRMKLLARVKPLMIQYRKNIVDNKWIKHRNHTYYDLTDRGRNYLEYYIKNR